MKNGFFRNIFLLFGAIAFLSVFLYGIGSLMQMTQVSPDGFIPKTLESAHKPDSWLTILSPVFVFLYAFCFLPIVVLFSITWFRANPYAIVIAGCMLVLSFMIEIMNALPLISFLIAHKQLKAVSPEMMLYLRQTDAIHFLAYDVAGFTLAYAGLFVYALLFFKSHKLFSLLILASIVLFIVNVPFLWVSPAIATTLMALSIFAFSVLPLFMLKMIHSLPNSICQQNPPTQEQTEKSGL
jgi:hypothetical protein